MNTFGRTMNDYNIKITVRNNRLLKAIKEAGYKSQEVMSEISRRMSCPVETNPH